tara:strand:- start:177 stop:545 length:369 start_codon:yes stop_codon:yes gene_type:complete
MNSCTFVGRLGRDAEIKEVGESKLISFAIGSDAGYGKNKSTVWLDCSIWGENRLGLADYLKKGTQVTVIGELSEREYKNKDGEMKKTLALRVNQCGLGGKSDAVSKPAPAPKPASLDDDIPF